VKVVIAGRFSASAARRIAGMFPGEWQVVLSPPEDAAGAAADADVLIPEHLPVDAALLGGARRLRLVQTGAGYDHVDVPACTGRGVLVAHARGVNAGAVAEHVFALVLAWFKNLLPLDRAMRQGEYDIEYAGGEISGKVLGIVGLGRAGREVGRLAAAFGMQALGYHYRPMGAVPGIELVDLSTLLRRADIVTLHVALNPETRHLIGRRELALMKRDALLVNTARGPIVDEGALIEALEQRGIGGAALDVFEVEPLPRDSPLRTMPNVLLTPHTAGMPDGFKFHRKRYEFFVANIRRVCEGRMPANLVNSIL
jgi:D-3-phosphoglycerate dehydrogenase